MLQVPYVMQPLCQSSDTFTSFKLFSANHGRYENMVARGCQKLDFKHHVAIPKQPIKYAGKLSHESHSLKALATPDVSVVKVLKDVATYRFWMEIDGQLKVLITKKNNDKYGLRVEVESSQIYEGQDLIMIWGIFRDDSASFIPLDKYNTVETPFMKDSMGRLAVELDFDESSTPFYVSMLLKSHSGSNSKISTIKSQRKTNFVVPVGFFPGHPSPLGISFTDDGYTNFALLSRSAESVVLCLYADGKGEKPALELDLDPYVNRTGDIWHALVDCSTFVSYSYRCRISTGRKGRRVFLDPYATVLEELRSRSPGKLLGKLLKEPTFDWSGENRPNIPMEKLIIYRLNVGHFTKDRSSKLPGGIAGSFYGVSEKLHHFRDLGVNAVLLEPIVPFDELKGPYFPRHFFSPSSLYGPSGDPKTVANSMKEMVKKLHANGIEVFLEVVFTHTAMDMALADIDYSSYYHTQAGEELTSRNTLNCNYPIVQQMILENLRYWVIEYHIDGFCFVNASSLTRGFHGEFLSRPPLIESIAFDPVLSRVKLIADLWDPHDNNGVTKEKIVFPHWKRWAEVNDKFCVDVRNYLRGQGQISSLATRLCGSGDIFLNGRGPGFSLNFITRNSGITLVDLASFSIESELSWNCGEEGATTDMVVLDTRLKQIRNFLFILFISLGVPVLTMGDECGQSYGGSPAYANRKPLDWNALKSGFGIQVTQFILFLSSLKSRQSKLLQNRNFLKEDKIEWRGPDGSTPGWEDPSCKFLAMRLKADVELNDLFLAFNSGDCSEKVALPEPPDSRTWVCLVDTALTYPGFFSADCVVPLDPGSVTYDVKSHSCVLFEARGA